MTGDHEKKGLRTKCLSRNKRFKSNSEKKQDLQSLGLQRTFESNQDACVQRADAETGSKVRQQGIPEGHIKGVYHFSDSDNNYLDDVFKKSGEPRSGKRKRIDSKESELSSSSTDTVKHKFKRSCRAVDSTKLSQDHLPLGRGESTSDGSSSSTSTEAVTGKENRLGNEESKTTADAGPDIAFTGNNASVDEMLQGELGIQGKVNAKCEPENVCNNSNSDKVWDGRVISKDQVCPICGLFSLPSQSMDVINKHINSCLDKSSGGTVPGRTEEAYSTNGELTNVVSNSPAKEPFGDLFFCQLCQKDLSRMNSQRRQQHVNRCCDQSAVKTKESETLATTVVANVGNQLECPICGKRFKSPKSHQTHVKKCAQQFGVDTNQLLEIVHREKECTSTASVAVGMKEASQQTESRAGGVKRKKKATHVSQREFDDDTRLAIALSASMAPPVAPAEKRRGKGKRKRNKQGVELPALLLRNEEEAQKAVAIRAAQVLSLQEDIDDDAEISCTPALVPSRLLQNNQSYSKNLETEVPKGNNEPSDGNLQGSRTVDKDDDGCSVQKESENELQVFPDDQEGLNLERKMESTKVDPALSKSFLSSLCDGEVKREEIVKPKPSSACPLWSLAADKHLSSERFYVPGLLPPDSPKRKFCQKSFHTGAEKDTGIAVSSNDPRNRVCSGTSVSDAVKDDQELTKAKEEKCDIDADKVTEITPSQAVNVDMLLQLAGEGDMSCVSMETELVSPASGFCGRVEEQDEESDTAVSGHTKLLQDLSSMVNNSHLSDVVIVTKHGRRLLAHNFMLSLRSEVLAKMLNDEAGAVDSAGRVCLKFEEFDQSVFEFVLRHIYTGDVTAPKEYSLDSVARLAERLKLPCLLRACRAEPSAKLTKVILNEEENEVQEFNTTDLEKLEDDIWEDGYNGDKLNKECSTAKDQLKNDELLNDEDIEEILIFQTQSLRREENIQHEDISDKATEQNESVDTREMLDEDVVFEEQICQGKCEKQVELLNPVEGKNKQVMTVCDEDEKVIYSGSSVAEKQALPVGRDDELEKGLPQQAQRKTGDDNCPLSTRDCEDKLELSRETADVGCRLVSRDYEEENPVVSSDSNPQGVSIECRELVSDSVNRNTQNGVQDHEICCDNKKVAENAHTSAAAVEEALIAKDSVEEKHARGDDCYPSELRSNILSAAAVAIENITAKETVKVESSGIEDPVTIEQGLKDRDVWSQQETNEQRFLADERTSWDEDIEGGSAGEEAGINESITLISDNDEEIALVSPQTTEVCSVPETPRLPTRHRINATRSSSPQTSENEADDYLCITESPRAKSREQLDVEANEFLAKLKRRVSLEKKKKKSGKTKQPTASSKKPHGSHDSMKLPKRRCDESDECSSPPNREQSHPFRGSPNISPISSKKRPTTEVVTVNQSPPLSPTLVGVRNVTPPASRVQGTNDRNSSSPVADLSRQNDAEKGNSDVEEVGDVEVPHNRPDNEADFSYGFVDLSTSSSPRDVLSPPVPSPKYSFLEPVVSPATPTSRRKAEFSFEPISPTVRAHDESAERQSEVGCCQQTNSPVSPSVCSFSSQVMTVATQERKNPARNLIRDGSFIEPGTANHTADKSNTLGEVNPDMSLRERLRLARLGREKDGDVLKDALISKDSNKSMVFAGDENDNIVNGDVEKDPCEVMSDRLRGTNPPEEDPNMSTFMDVDFYDDGGYNFDIEEWNNFDVVEGACDSDGETKNNVENRSPPEPASTLMVNEKSGKRTRDQLSNVIKQSAIRTDNRHSKATKQSVRTDGRHSKVTRQSEKTADRPSRETREAIRQAVTPKPNYDQMATPVLKSELQKFGVRALPKKKMVLKLKEIYDYTHQVESDSKESIHQHNSDKDQPLSSDDVASDVVDGMLGSGTASSSDEDEEEFGDCTVLIEDAVITASQQVNGSNLKERLLSYIRSNKELYKDVLLYKPLELVSLHQQIKENGINCSLGKLVDFLDEQCITFTTAGTRSRAPRGRGRRKKETQKR